MYIAPGIEQTISKCQDYPEALKQKFAISIPVPIKIFTCGRVTKNGIEREKI